jgi:nitrate/TMAO reductase-like tetraheme cytochrome c subunit
VRRAAPPGCLWIVLALVVIAILVGISSCGKSSTPSSSANKYESIAECEAHVEKLVKAPSTAHFKSDASGAGSGR